MRLSDELEIHHINLDAEPTMASVSALITDNQKLYLAYPGA